MNLTNFSRTRLFLFLISFFYMISGSVFGARNGELIVIMIAPSYAKSTAPAITKLPYTQNDIDFIQKALSSGIFNRPMIRSLMENVADKDSHPTKAVIEKQVKKWLRDRNITEDDTVIVFFSGHGIRPNNTEQTIYLVPTDFDENNLQESSVSVTWLYEQMNECPAKTKLLILDCCHAGNEGNLVSNESSQRNVENQGIMKSVPTSKSFDVITIASCGAHEKSYYWKEMNISLFSYHLGEGLRGNADVNKDQMITLDELYNYLSYNVPKTAESLGFKQTPVRSVYSGVDHNLVLVKLSKHFKTIDELLEDIARQITAKLQERKITLTGVLPFITVNQNGIESTSSGLLGLLPKNCTEKLERAIEYYLPVGYSQIRNQMLVSALTENGIKLEDIYTGKMNETIGVVKFIDPNEVKSFIVGKIKETNQTGFVEVVCELSGLPNITALGTFSGLVQLSQSEIASQGQSMQSKEKPVSNVSKITVAPITETTTPQNVTENTNNEIMNETSNDIDAFKPTESPKPEAKERFLVPTLNIQSCAFPVRFEVQRGRKWYSILAQKWDGRWYLPLQKGDIYRIRINNPMPYPVMARVLVDSLNTLPEECLAPEKAEHVKFSVVGNKALLEYVESLKNAGAIIVKNEEQNEDKTGYYQIAAPRNLDDARPWVLKPYGNYLISGFVFATGNNGKYKEFKVTDASVSVGSRTNFTEQLGLISIGIFTAVDVNDNSLPENSRAVEISTGFGAERRTNIKTNEQYRVGNILETQQFYYGNKE